ncbi:Hypp5766 [Branchiostoma lanceolatum]|uniref:Hypp5766 protein n=1 Tax=Branchiostoma lanceolatum TaxID=7740 RepID=A0A8J9YQZ3_BRALA|nr:Hypp5766 [Branchiostoma lanceolatum]
MGVITAVKVRVLDAREERCTSTGDPHITTFDKGPTLPFLDTLTTIQDDGSLRLNIYRKPTHTDQYLNFRSNHPLEHKLGVVKTLLHRADTIITDPHDRETEKKHIKQALKDYGYP